MEGEQSWAAPTKCWVRAAVALPECQRSNHFNVYVREAEAEAAAPTPLAVFRADLVAASFDLLFDSNRSHFVDISEPTMPPAQHCSP